MGVFITLFWGVIFNAVLEILMSYFIQLCVKINDMVLYNRMSITDYFVMNYLYFNIVYMKLLHNQLSCCKNKYKFNLQTDG